MSEKLRVVHVGCGGIASAWMNHISKMPEVEIVAMVDVGLDAARAKAEKHNIQNVEFGTNLEEMLKKFKPDAVFDCTPPEVHVDVTLTALKHGCHVMGEKPLADSMENAKKMVRAAQDAGKIYTVMQNRRYMPDIRRLVDFLKSGAIGTPHTVNCDFYLGPHFGGFREEMKHVLLLDMAIHTFDQARMITGASPVSVYCKDWNPVGSWYNYDASAQAIFEMSDGIVYNYRGSWCAEGVGTTWESSWRVQGSTGGVLWDGAQDFKAQRRVGMEGKKPIIEDVEVPSFQGELPFEGHGGPIYDFVQCVLHGGTPMTICTDNIKSLAMVFAAIESSETGKVVEVKI